MKIEKNHSENIKIRQVAREYEKNGYKVTIEPRGAHIPSFIKNYQPDLIAKNKKETVIIEVKTRSDFSTINKLRDAAELVNKKKNWRFELIMINPKDVGFLKNERVYIDFTYSEVENNLKKIKALLTKELFSPAFILSWANLESLSRQLLLEDKKGLINTNSLALIKTIFSLGYVSRGDYQTLEKLFLTRNKIIHGYKAEELDKKTLNKLIRIIQKLLNEKTVINADIHN